MKIKIYKENKPEKGDSDYLIKFPEETSVISLDPTIQILFVLDKDISDTRKILDLCRPWNYVRVVVIEVEFNNNHRKIYNKVSKFQPIEFLKVIEKHPVNIIIDPYYFYKSELTKNKDIELIKNSVPPGILPYYAFGKSNNKIYGSFRKRGRLNVWIGEDEVRLEYYNRSIVGNTSKGKYTYTFKTVSEALPMINELIGLLGYVFREEGE